MRDIMLGDIETEIERDRDGDSDTDKRERQTDRQPAKDQLHALQALRKSEC